MEQLAIEGLAVLLVAGFFVGGIALVMRATRKEESSTAKADVAEKSLAAKQKFDKGRDAALQQSDDDKLKWMRDNAEGGDNSAG